MRTAGLLLSGYLFGVSYADFVIRHAGGWGRLHDLWFIISGLGVLVFALPASPGTEGR